MIFTSDVKSAEIQIVDDGSVWMDMLRRAKEEPNDQ